MKNFLFVIMVFLIACSKPSLVIPPGDTSNSRYAPINEKERPGIVKYLNEGSASEIGKRREEAYKQMHTLCSGCYEIITEGPVEILYPDTTMYGYHGLNYSHEYPNEYVYIKFKCSKCAGK